MRVTTKERDELQRQLDDTARALHEKCEACSIGQGLEDRNKLLLEGVKSARAGFFAIQHNLMPSRANGGNVALVRTIVEEKIQVLESILAQVDGA